MSSASLSSAVNAPEPRAYPLGADVWRPRQFQPNRGTICQGVFRSSLDSYTLLSRDFLNVTFAGRLKLQAIVKVESHEGSDLQVLLDGHAAQLSSIRAETDPSCFSIAFDSETIAETFSIFATPLAPLFMAVTTAEVDVSSAGLNASDAGAASSSLWSSTRMDHIDVMERSLTIREIEVTHRRSNIPRKQLSVAVTPLNHTPDAYIAQRFALGSIKVVDPRFGTAMAEAEEWDCHDCDGVTHPAGVCFAEKLENWPLGAKSHRGPAPSSTTTPDPSTSTSTSSQPGPNIRIPAPRQTVPTDRNNRNQPPAQGSARPAQAARGRPARRGGWDGPSRGTRGRGRGGF
ncbi:hypothetical protein EXIGLDRAFT_749459 [Exidia glandulosa HHB12029]|uniref:Uncharacterized protein n=1 Tax=Exidia glandulosa HHB12029 TaxID=1314781 RepID=A0A165I2F0_EXIGL|nr:hypothetical protein EXIGLDRAFT_749459 [Exidia glandulosa HHB12029]